MPLNLVKKNIIEKKEQQSTCSVFEGLLDKIWRLIVSDDNMVEIHFKNSSCFVVFDGSIVSEHKNIFFDSNDQLFRFIKELSFNCSLRIDYMSPSAGGVLANKGLRWHAVIQPAAKEPILIFRRIRFSEVSLNSFINKAQFSYLLNNITSESAVVIYGKTGSGKSTFMYKLLTTMYGRRNLICLERYEEFHPLPGPWLRLVESPKLYSGQGGVELSWLLEQTLRLSCDVVCVGEILGSEAKVFLDIAESGHGPCFATIHAANASSCIERLRVLSGYKRSFMLPLVLIGMHDKKIRSLHLKGPNEKILDLTHQLLKKQVK